MTSTLTRLSAIAALAVCSTAAEAATILYNDFSSTAGLTLNGTATQSGNALRLTQALESQGGSAFSTTAVSLGGDASFSTMFTFQISGRGGLGNGADGLTFTVQTNSNSVGGIGGGLGYAGIPNSVAIEFDTFNNSETGGSNHVGIDLNGSVASVASTGLLAPDFDNASIWSAWVDYNGVTDLLEVRWAESTTNRPLAAMLSYNVDLTTVLNSTNAFVGFTAGTGSGYGAHDIRSWQFESSFAPIGVAAPAPLALVLSGLLAGLLRRRSLAA